MKKLLIAVLALTSISAFAQVPEVKDDLIITAIVGSLQNRDLDCNMTINQTKIKASKLNLKEKFPHGTFSIDIRRGEQPLLRVTRVLNDIKFTLKVTTSANEEEVTKLDLVIENKIKKIMNSGTITQPDLEIVNSTEILEKAICQ